MKKGRSIIGILLFLIIGSILVAALLTFLFQNNAPKDEQSTELEKESLHIVAIGDSLTEGVGDATNNGGYVPMIADLLEETDAYKEVTTSNYGKSGDRSDQVLERFYENKSIQKDIETADIVVLTVGGNDIIQTFKQNFLTIAKESFILPEEAYKENLKTLLSAFKELNPTVQIYVFGIYNPYYIYFPEITEMQDIMNKWNKTTQEVVNETTDATFLSIADLFNPSLKKDLLIDEDDPSETEVNHPYLYEEDMFHPNEAGYKLMSEVLFQAIVEE